MAWHPSRAHDGELDRIRAPPLVRRGTDSSPVAIAARSRRDRVGEIRSSAGHANFSGRFQVERLADRLPGREAEDPLRAGLPGM